MMRRIALAAFLVFSVVFVASAPYFNWIPSVSASGVVKVLITDPPQYSDDVTRIDITFTQIALHQVDGEGEDTWIVLDGDSTTINLMEIIDVTVSLGSFEVPAGNYNQLRFMTSTASAMIDGETVELTIPSGAQTGLKVHFQDPLVIYKDIVATVTVDITVDDHSLHNGKLVPSMSATIS